MRVNNVGNNASIGLLAEKHEVGPNNALIVHVIINDAR